MSINDSILHAQRRQQPYINLTNHKYALEDIFAKEIVEKYAKLKLKSLYFRVGKLELNKAVAEQINQLVKNGIREIFIFCDEDAELTPEAFSKFLQDNQIRINLIIAPIAEEDLEQIAADFIGQNNMLGFAKLVEYHVVYRNEHKIALLNSQISDQVIRENHQAYKRKIADDHTYGVKEPEYITNSSVGADKRATKLAHLQQGGIEALLQLEVSQHIKVDISVDREVEQENELDIDQDQLANKFRCYDAVQYVSEKLRKQFKEEYLFTVPKPLNRDLHDEISRICNSAAQIQYITQDALNFMLPHWHLFSSGLNIHNMPLGLAFKDSIIFASEKRPAKMPIDGLTLDLDYPAPTPSDPIKYSWLYFASQSSISLNDIYGTEDAPRITGLDTHPMAKGAIENNIDIMMDIPSNHFCAKYIIDAIYQHHDCTKIYYKEAEGLLYKNDNSIIYDDMFPTVVFYNVSAADEARLRDIWHNLELRGIHKSFATILLKIGVNDGNFLLDAPATVFLAKLFKEIMPLNGDPLKNKFIKDILTLFNAPPNKSQHSLADIFEAVDEGYNKLLAFMLQEEVDNQAEKEELIAKFAVIIKHQLQNEDRYAPIESYKIAIGRIIAILELNAQNGGNLAEQLTYLSLPRASQLGQNPKFLIEAGQFDFNVITSTTNLALSEYTKPLIDVNTADAPQVMLQSALKYLLTVAPHQRASIDTFVNHYAKFVISHPLYYDGCTAPNLFNLARQNINQTHLQTVEYIKGNLLNYHLPITFIPEGGKPLILDDDSVYWSMSAEPLAIEKDVYGVLHVAANNQLKLVYYINGKVYQISYDNMYQNSDTQLLAYIMELHKQSGMAFGLLDKSIIWMNMLEMREEEAYKLLDMLQEDGQITLQYGMSGLHIIYDGKNFELFEQPNDAMTEQLLDKATITLPAILDAKIAEWYNNGMQTEFIALTSEDIAGTFLADKLIVDDTYHYLNEKAERNAEVLQQLLDNEPKNTIIQPCYAPLTLANEEVNFVQGFTTKQVLENLRLLALNIVASTKEHYTPQYPDQEFAAYAVILSKLFAEMRIDKPIEFGIEKVTAFEDYNAQTVYIKPKTYPNPKLPEVEAKEVLHKETIAKFINIYQQNKAFSFGEVMALGLVSIFDPQNAQQVIAEALELHNQYGDNFYQLLRVLIATPSTLEVSDVELIKMRAANIAHSISFLTGKAAEGDIPPHAIITNNGKNPENLVFFAACFSDGIIDIQELLSKINRLPAVLKDQLLNSFAQSKLSLHNTNFPNLTLGDFDNHEALKGIISKAEHSYVLYAEATRFNKITNAKLQKVKPNFQELEDKYAIEFSAALKACTFEELSQEINKDVRYLVNNIENSNISSINVQALELDFAITMFASLSNHEGKWQSINAKAIKLLFNPDATLHQQFNNLEYNQLYLNRVLKLCKDDHAKEELLDILLGAAIPYSQQQDVIIYLATLPVAQLQQLDLNITAFLKLVPSELYAENIALFKVATDFILNNQQTMALAEFYQMVNRATYIKDSASFFANILEYCHKHKDFALLKFVAALDTKAKNFCQLITWLTHQKAENIKQLVDNNNLNIKQLISIHTVKKLDIAAEIAISLDIKLTKAQYSQLIKYIKSHNLDDAQLFKSYLLAPKSAEFNEQAKIELIFKQMHALNTMQKLFADANLWRFVYDVERVKNKINEITNKTGSQSSAIDNQQEMLASFITVMKRAKDYRHVNYNELHDKSLALKHKHTLHKNAAADVLKDIELEFLALMMEVMYRETGKFPRDTQVLSILNTILHTEHLIAEIATGQGKSIITALHAAYLWLTGQTVDVVTSSRELSARDLAEFTNFYDALGIAHGVSIITPKSDVTDYRKDGVNYALVSDLALFRADREFYSNKHDVSLNAKVGVVCDEIDATLTTDVNFKLALPLVNTNPSETKVLFTYILEFSESQTFKNAHVSRADDVQNLQLFLNYQFEKYDAALHFPLNAVQLDNLKKSSDALAHKLLILHNAMVKCGKDVSKLFDKLLDAVSIAKNLQKGVHFVVLNVDADDALSLKAVPIIKDQPSKDTVFGDGVHALLHILLEQQHPEWAGRFEVLPPSATIFNVSPKNFFDYYHVAGGRIIGLTGTAGAEIERQEFYDVNKLGVFAIPKYDTEHKLILPPLEVNNIVEQHAAVIDVLKKQLSDQPVLVFCESAKQAESLYKLLAQDHANVQLCAASAMDTDTVENVLLNAGKQGVITVTTPMLGRGTDFLTKHPDGYLAINLCTDITENSLWQIYGRVARNGDHGTVLSIFNREVFAENERTPSEHMDAVSNAEKYTRLTLQPLTDILKYFGNVNQDQILNAIMVNEFITKTWRNLLAENEKLLADDNIMVLKLRANLVALAKEKYPLASQQLDAYLARIDSRVVGSSLPYHADYVTQHNIATEASYELYDENNKPKAMATSTFWMRAALPRDNAEQLKYNYFIRASNVKMLTHAFELKKNKIILEKPLKIIFMADKLHSWQLGHNKIYFEVAHDNKLIVHLRNYKPHIVTIQHDGEYGLTAVLAKKIQAYKNSSTQEIKLAKHEEAILREYLWQKLAVNYSDYVEGVGSLGSLMLDEFKYSFAAYVKKNMGNEEIQKISHLIDNLLAMQDVDVSKFAYNKYQAIVLPVHVDSSAGHIESILTNGKFLFWLNRGFGFVDPGIKVFKIIHDISRVQEILSELKGGKSQTETRQAIYSLLQEEGDENVPEHILVPMKPQIIGNCGWVQIESMLYALGIVGYMGDLQELPNIQNPEWQQILKNAGDIYNDFITFDHIVRAEAALYAIDKNFMPQFLDNIWQQKIDDMRQFVVEPIAHNLLAELVYKLEDTASNYIGTIYEGQYNIVLRKLQLEEALASEMGLALQTAVDDYSTAKQFLTEYQNTYLGDFYDLQQIYATIKESSINLYDIKYNLLKAILHFIASQPIDLLNISELIEVLSISIPKCIAKKAVNDEYCILEAFAEKATSTITDGVEKCINIYADEFSLLVGSELFTDNPI